MEVNQIEFAFVNIVLNLSQYGEFDVTEDVDAKTLSIKIENLTDDMKKELDAMKVKCRYDKKVLQFEPNENMQQLGDNFIEMHNTRPDPYYQNLLAIEVLEDHFPEIYDFIINPVLLGSLITLFNINQLNLLIESDEETDEIDKKVLEEKLVGGIFGKVDGVLENIIALSNYDFITIEDGKLVVKETPTGSKYFEQQLKRFKNIKDSIELRNLSAVKAQGMTTQSIIIKDFI